MTIAPVTQRLHPQLDTHQREVVGHTGGPLLVVAGPGSGKTGCIERRAVNLLLLEEAGPGELVLCTFGRDAAGELADRFSASAQACGIAGAASGVRISTIHSLCHSLLAPHAPGAGLRQDYELLEVSDKSFLPGSKKSDRLFTADMLWGAYAQGLIAVAETHGW